MCAVCVCACVHACVCVHARVCSTAHFLGDAGTPVGHLYDVEQLLPQVPVAEVMAAAHNQRHGQFQTLPFSTALPSYAHSGLINITLPWLEHTQKGTVSLKLFCD